MAEQTITTNRFQRRREKSRAALMQAAQHLFLERGYDAVSVHDITDTADLGRGTFYLHFADKAEIAWALVREGFEAQMLALPMKRGHLSQAQQDFRGYCAFFAYIDRQRPLFTALAASSGAWAVTEHISGYVILMAHQRLAVGDLFTGADVPPDVTAQFMTGALMRVVRGWLQAPDSCSPMQMAAYFYRLLHGKTPPD